MNNVGNLPIHIPYTEQNVPWNSLRTDPQFPSLREYHLPATGDAGWQVNYELQRVFVPFAETKPSVVRYQAIIVSERKYPLMLNTLAGLAFALLLAAAIVFFWSVQIGSLLGALGFILIYVSGTWAETLDQKQRKAEPQPISASASLSSYSFLWLN